MNLAECGIKHKLRGTVLPGAKGVPLPDPGERLHQEPGDCDRIVCPDGTNTIFAESPALFVSIYGILIFFNGILFFYFLFLGMWAMMIEDLELESDEVKRRKLEVMGGDHRHYRGHWRRIFSF